jgi:Rrf2 family transcriptional regulator, iron-sulfur cluster assembly transcription factor
MNFNTSKLPAIIEAMLYICYNGEAQPLGGKKLAEIMDLNPRYLEPFLQNLVKYGVLHSAKGAKGGYSLAIPSKKLTIAKICEIATCSQEKMSDEEQSKLQQAVIIPTFRLAETAYVKTLGNFSLHDLCEQVKFHNLEYLLKSTNDNDETVLHYVI